MEQKPIQSKENDLMIKYRTYQVKVADEQDEKAKLNRNAQKLA